MRLALTYSIRGRTLRAAHYQRQMTVSGLFFIDKYPVTNAQFKKFLDATHYRPQATTTTF